MAYQRWTYWGVFPLLCFARSNQSSALKKNHKKNRGGPVSFSNSYCMLKESKRPKQLFLKQKYSNDHPMFIKCLFSAWHIMSFWELSISFSTRNSAKPRIGMGGGEESLSDWCYLQNNWSSCVLGFSLEVHVMLRENFYCAFQPWMFPRKRLLSCENHVMFSCKFYGFNSVAYKIIKGGWVHSPPPLAILKIKLKCTRPNTGTFQKDKIETKLWLTR